MDGKDLLFNTPESLAPDDLVVQATEVHDQQP